MITALRTKSGPPQESWCLLFRTNNACGNHSRSRRGTLPNTGAPENGDQPIAPPAPLLLVPLGLLAVGWRRGRVVVVLVIAGLAANASPATLGAISSPHGLVARVAVPREVYAPPVATTQLSTEKPRTLSWRVVIPRIGVDAAIEPVGRDSLVAMSSPSSLDTVGWFNLRPKPGEAGDAVLDGHFC